MENPMKIDELEVEWLVEFMENPNQNWMITRGSPFFR